MPATTTNNMTKTMTTTTKTTINTIIKVMIITIKINNTIRINSMIKITIRDMPMKALKLSKHILIQTSWNQDMMLHDLLNSLIKRSQEWQLTLACILWLSCTTTLQSSKIWFTTKLKRINNQRTQEPSRPSQLLQNQRWSKRAKNRQQKCGLQPREEPAWRRPILLLLQARLQLILLNQECLNPVQTKYLKCIPS